MFSLGRSVALLLVFSIISALLDFELCNALSTSYYTSSSTIAATGLCQCIRFSDCESLAWQTLQNCAPGMVCCARSRSQRNAPWQWDTRSFTNENYNRFGSAASTTNYGHSNMFDYKDAKTRQNCPWEFYEDSYTNDHPASNYDNHHQHHNHQRHHHHHHHERHEHHLTLPAGYDFRESSSEEDDDYGGDHRSRESVNSWRAASQSRPIIFPDDKRYTAFKTITTTTATPTTKATRIATTTSESSNKNQNRSVLNSAQCGVAVGQRIIGGMDGAPGQFPWITRIAYLNKTSNRISYRCSGSVISDLYILTAAHCVINLVDELELSHLRIGDDDFGSTTSQSANIYRISSIIVHPSYDRPKYANDIALVRLQRSANKKNLVAICLPLNNSDTLGNLQIGSTGIVAGWGTVNNEDVSSQPKVKYLRLPVVNTTECAITYAKYSENFDDQIVITPSQLCAQGQPMNDVCKGDSGGPFMDDGSTQLAATSGRYTLMGIVAFGPTTCGVSNIPGVYTRVSSFLDWIVGNLL